MKVALCSTFVPFVYGGGRFIVEWLEQKLLEHGHEVERIYLPFVGAPDTMFSQMTALRLLDLTQAADRLIAIRPPAHVIAHPAKVVWLIHHLREFYDLWGTPYQTVPDDAAGRAIRRRLFELDTVTLGEARRLFTNSRVVADRLKRFNGLDGEVLYPPILNPERFGCRHYGDEVVYICRVEAHKRQLLFVQAMRHTRSAVRLRLCGTGLGRDYLDEITTLVRSEGLEQKVTLELRWIDEDRKAELLSTALATIYAPIDEDSYGYSSLEASHAGKAVLTTTDSGGVLELVEDGLNGLVVAPEPEAIAEALDRLFLDRDTTRRMGEAARARLGELAIGWDHVVARLLA